MCKTLHSIIGTTKKRDIYEDISFFFFFDHTCHIWKFLGQVSNTSHSSGNAGCLRYCARPWIKPVPQQLPEPLQRQCQILNTLCYSGNSHEDTSECKKFQRNMQIIVRKLWGERAFFRLKFLHYY